jgi:hypothetical protein
MRDERRVGEKKKSKAANQIKQKIRRGVSDKRKRGDLEK